MVVIEVGVFVGLVGIAIGVVLLWLDERDERKTRADQTRLLALALEEERAARKRLQRAHERVAGQLKAIALRVPRVPFEAVTLQLPPEPVYDLTRLAETWEDGDYDTRDSLAPPTFPALRFD